MEDNLNWWKIYKEGYERTFWQDAVMASEDKKIKKKQDYAEQKSDKSELVRFVGVINFKARK